MRQCFLLVFFYIVGKVKLRKHVVVKFANMRIRVVRIAAKKTKNILIFELDIPQTKMHFFLNWIFPIKYYVYIWGTSSCKKSNVLSYGERPRRFILNWKRRSFQRIF